MNNSVFGKTRENIRNRVDIHSVTNEDQARKLISKTNYQHRTIFCDNYSHEKKTHLVFNKQVCLGMCILDLSKTLMYEFHYMYIKPKYKVKAKLLFTDTDSLIYEIETEDFYKDIFPDIGDKLILATIRKIIHRGLRLELIRKSLECLKMKLEENK